MAANNHDTFIATIVNV